MNMCDAVVTRVCGVPYQSWGLWFLKVEINCYGNSSYTILSYVTKEEAEEVEEGTEVLV